MRPVDPRVLRWVPSARRRLAVTGGLAVLRAGLVVAQAVLLGDLLARAFAGRGPDLRRGSALLVVLLVRAVVHAMVELSSRSASAATRAALRDRLGRHAAACGPARRCRPPGRGPACRR